MFFNSNLHGGNICEPDSWRFTKQAWSLILLTGFVIACMMWGNRRENPRLRVLSQWRIQPSLTEQDCVRGFILISSCSSLSLQGYLFISVLVNSNSELIRLINNAIKNDLSSRNPTFMCLALHCIANVGSREMAEAFASEIPRILVAGWVKTSRFFLSCR